MNICILAPENSPSWGGVGAYTLNLIKNIPSKNEIHVLTMNRDIEDSFEKLLGDHVYIHNICNVRGADSFFCNLGFQLAVFKKIKELNKQFDFDVIHSHSGHLPHLLSQFLSIAPSIVTVHATVYGLKKSIDGNKFKKDKTESLMKLFSSGIQYFEKIGFDRANRLIPVSNFTLSQMIEYYGYNDIDKVNVLYNAVDPSLFRPNKKTTDESINIIFVGRLYAVKGIDIFLDALKIISKKKYPFKVSVFGRGETERVRKKLSAFLPSDRYEINGRVSYLDMPPIYNHSDILVVSSVYENFPTTILEAMSSKTLVVASNVGGIPEIIKDGFNGFLFEKGSALQLALLLEKLITSQIDIEPILNNALKTISENYEWSKRGKEIFEEYKKVLE